MLLSSALALSPAPATLPAVTAGNFRAIYDEHFALVFRTLRRFGVPDASLDDAAQDVFVVVHTKLGGFEGRSSLKTWIFGITRRIASKHRREKREHLAEGDIESFLDSHTFHKPASERVDKARFLFHLLSKLTEEQKELFLLVELEQFTIREAAELLGEKQEALASRLRRTRQQLQRRLETMKSQEDWRVKWRS